MRHCGWLLGLLSLFSLATHASDWQEIKNEAKGQTVWSVSDGPLSWM